MRSTAFSRRHIAWLATALVVGGSSPAFGQRVALCKDPPGGQISCEENQMASCAVDDKGHVDGRCKNIPKNMRHLEMKAWTLSQVLGKAVAIGDLNRPEYVTILREGRAKSKGKTITFSIPEEKPKSESPPTPEL